MGHIGFFPQVRAPRVIWIGVSEGREKIIELAGSIDRELKGHGFRSDKNSFIPHITIGRTKKHGYCSKKKVEELTSSIDVFPAESLVKNITFFSSGLTPTGPQYNVVEKIPVF